ncbi:MAG: carboxyl-terminal proteinase [Planctomycetota bacterium]|jgi:carboxyl-terminal processing protease
MPKRNVVILVASLFACLIAWAARERGGHGHRFGELMTAIERHYVHEIDAEQLFTAAATAAVAGLDEHSAYLQASERADLEATLDQAFAGVGLELSLDPVSRQPIVVAPVFPGPGWRAGLEPGDRILAVDGIPIAGRPLRQVVGMLRGPIDTPVQLLVASAERNRPTLDPSVQPADEPRELTLIRELVEVETVQGDRRGEDGRWQWLLEGDERLAYLRIESFGERTAEEFAAAVDQIAAVPDLEGVILDLRGNPGGLVRSAVAVCDSLLADGPIVETRSARGGMGDAVAVDIRRATPPAALVGVPLTVLVDGLTASAAEIVAACLQDAGRATVVGGRTFGKGTVQSLIPLSDGRGLLKLTTAEYFRPNKKSIHRGAADGDDAPWGVQPDPGCEVTPTAEAVDRVREWRRGRTIPPRPGQTGTAAAGQHRLPREIDAVLARGIEVTRAGQSDRSLESE